MTLLIFFIVQWLLFERGGAYQPEEESYNILLIWKQRELMSQYCDFREKLRLNNEMNPT